MKKALIAVTFGVAVFALAGGLTSGLNVGEKVTPFHPKHISGPDKGTDTCPPCKYGSRPAVQVWVNGDAEENVLAISKALSAEVADSKAELKAFVINLTSCEKCVTKANMVASKAKLDNVGMAILANNDKAVSNYKVNIDADVKNTVFVYRNKSVVAKFVNLKADKAGLAQLQAAIVKAEN